ncbi:MAG TPA: right-handed parallel beta-helix repeat-containing protein [Opitutaceae bacterium]
MKRLHTFASFTLLLCSLLLCPGMAQAEDISGPITTTVTIYENSRLVGDVTCLVVDEPCIKFGTSHIKLRLNGFTMTGRANPPSDCVPPDPTLVGFLPEDGIATDGQSHVAILGPGLVQRFRRYGIIVGLFPNPNVISSSKVTVKHVTSHHNCFSGLQLAFVSDSVIEENVSVRNAIASGAFSCGGTCILQSDNNRIRRNEYSGNGLASPNNDFGIGILAGSDGNVIEENGVGGNTNGIWIAATAGSGNVVRRNIIAGNPPVQLGATGGVDIRDNSSAGTITFKENLCITYLGFATPPPCPNIPKVAVRHHPQSHDGDDDDEDDK